MKLKNIIAFSDFKINAVFILKHFFVVFFLIINSHHLIASELKRSSPDQPLQSGIYISNGTTVVGEISSAILKNEPRIYVSTGTTIIGEKNISISRSKSVVTNVGSQIKNKVNSNNVIVNSKSFKPQPDVKDKELQSQQEKSIEKVKNTLLTHLPKTPLTTFEEYSSNSGVVSSNSSQVNLGANQIAQKNQIFYFATVIKKQQFNSSFLFKEKFKNRRITLRGPPSLVV